MAALGPVTGVHTERRVGPADARAKRPGRGGTVRRLHLVVDARGLTYPPALRFG